MSAEPIKGLTPLKAVAILNQVPLFKLLTPNEKQHLVENLSLFYHIPANQQFITFGDTDDGFYIIISGTAKIIHSGEELGIVTAGNFVGETGFMGTHARSASVIAQTDIIGLKFTRNHFQMLPIRAREIIKDHIIEGLVQRVELLNLKVVKQIKANPAAS